MASVAAMISVVGICFGAIAKLRPSVKTCSSTAVSDLLLKFLTTCLILRLGRCLFFSANKCSNLCFLSHLRFKWTLSAVAVLHSRKRSCSSSVVKLESFSLQVLTVYAVHIFSNLVSCINWRRMAWLVRVAISCYLSISVARRPSVPLLPMS